MPYVIESHKEHINDIDNAIARQNERLTHLKACQDGLKPWVHSKKQLSRDIAIAQGKLDAYNHCKEMAIAFSHSSGQFDPNATEFPERRIARKTETDIKAPDAMGIDRMTAMHDPTDF